MAQLVASTELTTTYTAYEIEAPDIAVSARPGHMVLFRAGDLVAPAPCAITDCDSEKGTVTIVTRVRISPAGTCCPNYPAAFSKYLKIEIFLVNSLNLSLSNKNSFIFSSVFFISGISQRVPYLAVYSWVNNSAD